MTNDAPTHKGQSPADRFRSRLIGPTLESALEIPFYARHWKGRQLQLDQLPTVTKQQLLQDLAATLRPKGVPANVGHSTGTTGQPFFRVRGRAEIGAYSEYLRSVRKATAARTGKPVPPTLMISGAPVTIHGSVLPLDVGDMRLAVDVFSAEGLAAAVDLLTGASLRLLSEGFERTLSLSPGGAMLLTQELLRRDIPTADLGISTLCTFNSALLPPQRELLRKHWDARLVERFSMSEVLGGATLCYDCGHHHVDPVVLPEVLETGSDRPADETGELVLTELHPFSQLQPMIRYRTGDLVRRTFSPCVPGDLAFDYLGRAKRSVLDGGQLVLGELEAIEAVADLPGLAREAVGEERAPVGSPLVSLHHETDGTALVAMEVRVTAGNDADAAGNLAGDVHERITPVLHGRGRTGIPLRVTVKSASTPAS